MTRNNHSDNLWKKMKRKTPTNLMNATAARVWAAITFLSYFIASPSLAIYTTYIQYDHEIPGVCNSMGLIQSCLSGSIDLTKGPQVKPNTWYTYYSYDSVGANFMLNQISWNVVGGSTESSVGVAPDRSRYPNTIGDYQWGVTNNELPLLNGFSGIAANSLIKVNSVRFSIPFIVRGCTDFRSGYLDAKPSWENPRVLEPFSPALYIDDGESRKTFYARASTVYLSSYDVPASTRSQRYLAFRNGTKVLTSRVVTRAGGYIWDGTAANGISLETDWSTLATPIVMCGEYEVSGIAYKRTGGELQLSMSAGVNGFIGVSKLGAISYPPINLASSESAKVNIADKSITSSMLSTEQKTISIPYTTTGYGSRGSVTGSSPHLGAPFWNNNPPAGQYSVIISDKTYGAGMTNQYMRFGTIDVIVNRPPAGRADISITLNIKYT